MQPETYHLKFSTVILIAVCLFIPSSFAQLGIFDYFQAAADIVPDKMDLSVHEVISYDDNIHNRATHKKSSFNSKTGLSLELYKNVKQDTRYGIDGNVSYKYYFNDSDELSDCEWSISPFILGRLDFLGEDNLMITMSSHNYEDKYDTSDTTRVWRMNNVVSLTYDVIKRARFGLALSSNYSSTRYHDANYKHNNQQSYSFGASPYLKLTSKLKSGLYFSYKKTMYDSERSYNDSQSYSIQPYLTYQISSLLSATLRAGFIKHNYEGDARHYRGSNDWNPTCSGSLNYKPRKNVKFAFSSSMSWDDSAATRGEKQNWRNSLSATWEFSPKLTITSRLSANMEDEKNNASDATVYAFNLAGTYKFRSHISLFAEYQHEETKYKYFSAHDYDSNECSLGVRFHY